MSMDQTDKQTELSRREFLTAAGGVWTCSHESGHIWEEKFPHLSHGLQGQ